MKAKKILIVLMIIMSFSLILQINKVQAALQANGDEPAKKARNTWMTEVRQMEALGGTLGLKETQNADLTSSSGSNNLDIHMQKNTEYGAMALLSASAYGKTTKIENGETTTGNETGVVIPYNSEWVAAQYTDYNGRTSYAERYINYYVANDNEKKRGDATLETQGWHNSKYRYVTYWIQWNGNTGFIYTGGRTPYGLVRNIESGGIFGFCNRDIYGKFWNGTVEQVAHDLGKIENTWTSRAVIVNGEGV